MRCKKTLILVVALLVLFSSVTFARTQNIRRVGVVPLMKGGVTGPDDLRALIEKYADQIQVGFAKVGAGDLYPDFMDQVKSAAIKEDVIPKGQHMEWMLFRKGRAVQDLNWAGNEPLPVHMFIIQKDCKDFHFIVPKPCGNIALVETRNSKPDCDIKVSPEKASIGDTITVDMGDSKCATRMVVKVYHPEGNLIETKELTAGNSTWTTSFNEGGDYFLKGEVFNADGVVSTNDCEAEVHINFPPVCELKVDPVRGHVNQIFKLDASRSSDQDGEVVKAEFTITQDGTELEKKEIAPPPLIWNKKFTKSGKYKIFLKVTDDFNAVSANKCELEVYAQKRRFNGLVEAGPMVAKGTYTGFVFGRVGFAYLLVPGKFSLVCSAGGAINLGSDAFKSHFLANFLLNAHFDAFFIGAGVGYSGKVRDDWKAGADFVANIGIDIFQSINKKGSIFGELRVPLRSGLEFNDAHEILLGVRLLF